jgi:hypothetical protein
VTRECPWLYGQAANQPCCERFASKENEFFLNVVEARIRFIKDKEGKIAGLALHPGGQEMPAKGTR